MNIETGMILIATDPLSMPFERGDTLIVGKEYPVKSVDGYYVKVDTELVRGHLFDLDKNSIAYWGKFFKIKDSDSEQPDLSEPLKLAQHQRHVALVNAFATIEAFAVPSYTPIYEGYAAFREYLLEMYEPK